MVYALERGSSEHFRLSEGAEMMSHLMENMVSMGPVALLTYALEQSENAEQKLLPRKKKKIK